MIQTLVAVHASSGWETHPIFNIEANLDRFVKKNDGQTIAGVVILQNPYFESEENRFVKNGTVLSSISGEFQDKEFLEKLISNSEEIILAGGYLGQCHSTAFKEIIDAAQNSKNSRLEKIKIPLSLTFSNRNYALQQLIYPHYFGKETGSEEVFLDWFSKAYLDDAPEIPVYFSHQVPPEIQENPPTLSIEISLN